MDDHDFHGDHDHPDEGEPYGGPIPKNDFYYADNIELTTVGIDVGSSTSHLMFSKLHLQRLGQYLSSRYVVVDRKVLHRSPILLTPYTQDYEIDGAGLDTFVKTAYREAEFTPDDIDTGAVILTGEAVKRHNAKAIAHLFAGEAGKFVCASAGPNLEAVLAANGSGAVGLSREGPQMVMSVDVGGGTTKLALVYDGQVIETAAINVGGRLVATDEQDRIVRIEPASRDVAAALGVELHLDESLSDERRRALAEKLADCILEMMGRGPLSELSEALLLTSPLSSQRPVDAVVFSGGVSEYIYQREQFNFGDLAMDLAAALRRYDQTGRLPAPVRQPMEGIRATVMGASQFTVQVSGNTISVTNPDVLPMRNVQVLYPILPDKDDLSAEELQDAIAKSFQRFDLDEGEQTVALAIGWRGMPRYQSLRAIAEGIKAGLENTIATGLPVILVFTHDFGKLVGEILRNDLNIPNDVISIDSIHLRELDFIDIGEIIYPAQVVPVVVKSLVFPEVVGPVAEIAAR